jgi:hypothetical protein
MLQQQETAQNPVDQGDVEDSKCQRFSHIPRSEPTREAHTAFSYTKRCRPLRTDRQRPRRMISTDIDINLNISCYCLCLAHVIGLTWSN